MAKRGPIPAGYKARPAVHIRSPENAALICRRIAEGVTIRQIARELGGCTDAAIFMWIADTPEFLAKYQEAKRIQAERMAEDIIEISDDSTNDWVDREVADGLIIRVPDYEHINRSRLRVDTRKWLMTKMAPGRWGDKVAVEHSVSDEFAERLVKARQRALNAPTLGPVIDQTGALIRVEPLPDDDEL